MSATAARAGESLTPDAIAALFTAPDGGFLCARWGRPVAPVVFGLDDASLGVFRAATAAVLAHARHPMTETDPEMGANLMVFAVRDWDELADLPDLDRLTGREGLPERLAAQGAEQYRLFRFDPDGSIRARAGRDPELLIVDVERKVLDDARERFTYLDDRRSDLLS